MLDGFQINLKHMVSVLQESSVSVSDYAKALPPNNLPDIHYKIEGSFIVNSSYLNFIF